MYRFTKCAANRDGLYSYCKDCYNDYMRQRSQRQRQEMLERKYEQQILSGMDFDLTPR